jgi:hypothetical protein
MKTRTSRTGWIFFIGWIALGALPAPAKDDKALGIPPVLEPWKSWVLFGQNEKLCPTLYSNGDEHRCVWPSRLELTLSGQGGRFTQQWLAYAKTWVALPGDKETWPLQVRVNGRETAVVEKNGHPAVALEPGSYTVQGQFEWKEVPEMIHVPPESGLIQLNLNGKAVPFPLQESDGRLWLKKALAPEAQDDRLEVRVYRLLDDGIPMRVSNLFRINVAGRAREISLKGSLLEGFTPMGIQSPIPARIGGNGDLLIQARPGHFEISVLTRSQDPVRQIGPMKTVYGQEIWAFQPQNQLRMVKVEGAPAVDPSQTDSPAEWRNFATYLIDANSTIKLQQIKRGDPDPAPDRLSLDRTWWLDFDGQGFSIRDRIHGSMSRQWSLAMNPPVTLGRVNLDGKDQLITSQGKEKRAGLELRHGELNLEAESRMEKRSGRLPAVGWDHDFQSVSGFLNLPPGWRLLAAQGVDEIPGTWFARWTLLDLFIVWIISLAIYKLWSWRWGVLALVALSLTYHEPNAPRLVWVFLLAAIALLRFLPENRFKKLVRIWKGAALVVLFVIGIPFVVQQVRWAIYPQLEENAFSFQEWFEGRPHYYNEESAGIGAVALPMDESTGLGGISREASLSSEPQKMGRMAPQLPKAANPLSPAQEALRNVRIPEPQTEDSLETKIPQPKAQNFVVSSPTTLGLTGKLEAQDYYSNRAIQAFDAKALNQTGPGLPGWAWRSYAMGWTGPVEKNQTIRLWLLSPAANMVLAFIRVLLLAALLGMVLGLDDWNKRLPKLGRWLPSAAFLILIWPAQAARAGELPPPEILQELQSRLLHKSDCLPNCADSSKLELTANLENLRLLWQIHAAEETVVPLPGSADLWLPQQVLIDGAPAKGLSRDKEGRLWAVISKGVHQMVLQGLMPAVNDLQIPLPLLPHQVRYQSNGWEVQGVDKEGRVKAGIKLIRKQTSGNNKEISPLSVPPFFQVERIISLGLDWQVRSRIRRLTPAGAPVVLAVPLLQGESVTTAGLHVENNKVQIQMDPRTEELIWASTLKKEALLNLKAPQFVPWVETWILESSTIWHADLSGIPVIKHQDSGGIWRPQWQPWPGEEVAIRISRPEAVPGQIKTIDSVQLAFTPGNRVHRADLTVGLRTSQGDQQKIVLPEGADLEFVRINGTEQPIRAQGREVILPLQPGSQNLSLSWLQPAGSNLIMKSPEIRIGEKAVNADVQVEMPPNRWILCARGPGMGPAVIFWSYLVVIVLVAAGLGRSSLTPIKTWGWVLLGLGLTQIHVILSLMIVGWLLALGYRKNHPYAGGNIVFNLGQMLLGAWTIAALAGLYYAVQRGLLGLPYMQIRGNGSSDLFLKWTQDRIQDFLPQVTVYSVPLFVFRVLMLMWALWLAYALLKWLRWGWDCFGAGGMWRKKPGVKNKMKRSESPADIEPPAAPQ